MKKIKNFFKGVRKEAKVVRWPDGKTLVKYSCVTIFLLIFFALFFFIFTFVPELISWLGGLF